MTDERIARSSTGLADGEWHRLHPASPLLRGGLVLLAVIGIVIANLRERLAEFVLPIFSPELDVEFDEATGRWQDEWANDPIGAILSHGWLGWALLGLLVLLIVVVLGFWLSWRFHSFRVTDEAVEVRSGILFRSHRSARLDRIQGINLTRPLFARLFGTAKLDVSVAGQSGNVQLAYLSSPLADGLRADILRLSSGARAARARRAAGDPVEADAAAPAPADGPVVGAPDLAAPDADNGARARAAELVNRRVGEFLAPELDPDLAPPESVVHLPLGRVLGSTLLGGWLIGLLLMVALLVVGSVNGWTWIWFGLVPALIGFVSYGWSQVTKSLRYSIAGTPDGVRIGHGLLSTANRTIPPGRVHAVGVTQWILWRPFGWWTVHVNLAGQPIGGGSEAQTRTVVLPVGTADDVQRVLGLLLPDERPDLEDAIIPGLVGRGADGAFEGAPRRAAWLHPFQWRRIGWTERDGVVLARHGVLFRVLTLVPLARMQSVAIHTGPLRRMLRLATLRLHTVAGPVTAYVPSIDRDDAAEAFTHIAHEAVERAASDTSHEWGAAAERRAAAAPNLSLDASERAGA